MALTVNGKLVTDVNTEGIPKFGGIIYYVSKGSGADTNDGLTPDTPFETIGKGIDVLATGDAINVMAGTYTEINLDLNVAGCEIWFEIGAILAPVSASTALTISASYCHVQGRHNITNYAANIGVLISGSYCIYEDGKIQAGGTSVQITGDGCKLISVGAGLPTVRAYDIQANKLKMYDCTTNGNTTTEGFSISNTKLTGLLVRCTSVGHQTCGFCIESGCTGWTILNCSSGVGDGKWIDGNPGENAWSNFSFADEVYSTSDWSVIGGAAGSSNIFQFYGAVNILGIRGHVETQMHADVDTIKFTYYDESTRRDISDIVDPASAVVGSLIVKEKKSTDALVLYSASGAIIIEETNLKKAVFALNAIGTTTYIRFTWSGTATTGALHHHCDWEPLSDNGFVEEV